MSEDIENPVVFDLEEYLFMMSLPLNNGGELTNDDTGEKIPGKLIFKILNN